MNRPPPDEDQHNRIVAVTLDEESIGRSGPDIEHERAIAIYDLIEQNLFAPEGAVQGPFTLHLAITGNRLMFDIPRAPVVAHLLSLTPSGKVATPPPAPWARRADDAGPHRRHRTGAVLP